MLIPDDFTGGCIAVPKDMMRFSFLQGEKFMSEKMDYVYLVKIYDSTGRLLPIVTAFATRQGQKPMSMIFCLRVNIRKELLRVRRKL